MGPNNHQYKIQVAISSEFPDGIIAPGFLMLMVDCILVILPATGRKINLPEAAFKGFHPILYLPDRREVHTRNYGSPARANSPPAG